MCDKLVHIMVYVKEDIIRSWKKRSVENKSRSRKKKLSYPYAYGSGQPQLLGWAKEGLNNDDDGAIVWAFSSLSYGKYRLPPSLIASLPVYKAFDRKKNPKKERLVPEVIRQNRKWNNVVLADPDHSKYYKLNNAYSTLMGLEFVSKRSKRIEKNCKHCRALLADGKSIYSGLPAHLQRVRRLTPESGQKLQIYADEVADKKVVFLSYKRSNARRAVEIADGFMDHGFVCWLDNWMFNPELSTGKTEMKEEILKAALNDGIRQSFYFVSLVTENYWDRKPDGTTSWTEREWRMAVKLKKSVNPDLKIIEVLQGGTKRGSPDQVVPPDTRRVVKEIVAG